MEKEQLTADLVCLLEEATKPRDVASLKAEIESYFILAAARMDQIAKVMDLDNDIGTNNFDIPLLNKTEKAIVKLSESGMKGSQFLETAGNVLTSVYLTFCLHNNPPFSSLVFLEICNM